MDITSRAMKLISILGRARVEEYRSQLHFSCATNDLRKLLTAPTKMRVAGLSLFVSCLNSIKAIFIKTENY
jgi:hypothetical protein